MFRLAAICGLLATPALSGGLEIDVAGQANGTIVIDLFEDTAPMHAEHLTTLAEAGEYDGVVFHRVINGFMAQTGDVRFGVQGGDLRRAGCVAPGQANPTCQMFQRNCRTAHSSVGSWAWPGPRFWIPPMGSSSSCSHRDRS